MVEKIIQKLDTSFNDPEFKFDPIMHKYTYRGEFFIPVTRFIQQFHKEFDSDYWSEKKAKERDIPKSEVLKEWRIINERANYVGTETHKWIENYFNKVYQEIPTDLDVIKRINKFNFVFGRHLHKLTPIKFEQRVFSRKWKIAGTIDSLFLYNGKIYIIDYKTNKEFTNDENLVYKEFLLEPFDQFYKTSLNEYSIQVSLYTLILREYGIDVSGGYLLHIGPGDEEAKLHKCVNMVDILEKYLIDTQ